MAMQKIKTDAEIEREQAEAMHAKRWDAKELMAPRRTLTAAEIEIERRLNGAYGHKAVNAAQKRGHQRGKLFTALKK